MKLLEQGLEKLGIPETEINGISRNNILNLLQNYVKEIELFNEAYGLVKVANQDELIVKHILDSLTPLKIITGILSSHEGTSNLRFAAQREKKITSDTSRLCAFVREKIQDKSIRWHIADVGSGAGLPGIPLAVCLPQTEFTLIERMGRRAGFLQNCIAVLGLDYVRVEEADLEKAEPNRFDMAVFRAFRPLTPDILKGLVNILKPGGLLAAWKGRRENTQEEMLTAEKSLPGLKWEILPLSVPFLDEERHLTLIKVDTNP